MEEGWGRPSVQKIQLAWLLEKKIYKNPLGQIIKIWYSLTPKNGSY